MPATILVVDDEQSIRQLLRLHLEAAGYEVQVVADPSARSRPTARFRTFP